MLAAMNTPLEWITAIAAVIGATGGGVAWLGFLRARWQLRAETLRNSQDRRENELHRLRHAELYQWWHDMPDGPPRSKAMHWFGEWTGARDPYHGSDQGAIPPGFGVRDADEAYQRYIGFLDAMYHPGQLGPPPRALRAPGETDADRPGTGDEIPAIAETGKADPP